MVRVVARRRRPSYKIGTKSRTTAAVKPAISSRKQSVPKEVQVMQGIERVQLEKEKASAARQEKKIAVAKKAIARYQRDPDYRFLHQRISDLWQSA